MMSGFLPASIFDPFNKKTLWVYYIIGGIGLIFSLITWKTTHKNKPPQFVWIYSTMAFLVSIAWINMVANYLIEFLNFI